ncbi:MAG: MBL fold metallo-hydrolase [Holophagales bacterium]|nr:MBL fold metallo-hydrolase [Holophagales bacterium]
MLRHDAGVALIDTGIGLHDIADPDARIGRAAIDAAGFQFLPEATAIRQLAALSIRPADVTDIILTHCDPDHAGGLSDFPDAKVHLSGEEKQNLDAGNSRYGPAQFSHGPDWVTYESDDCEMLGLPARRVSSAPDLDIRLIPLFGHTNGHCGVAVHDNGTWILHVGDAYYLRDELENDDHPIDELATLAADDNQRRLDSLDTLRRLTRRSDVDLEYFGYHDVAELPDSIRPRWSQAGEDPPREPSLH